jgi:hypothetical protein
MDRVKFFLTFLSGCAILLAIMISPVILTTPLTLMFYLDSKGPMEFSTGEMHFFECLSLGVTFLMLLFTGPVCGWGLVNLCDWYSKAVRRIGMPFDVNLRFQYLWDKYCGE